MMELIFCLFNDVIIIAQRNTTQHIIMSQYLRVSIQWYERCEDNKKHKKAYESVASKYVCLFGGITGAG